MREITPWRNQRIPAIADTTTEYIYTPESEEPQLRDYWKMLVKRRRLVVLVFLVALGLGAFGTFQATPLYTASATLKIDPLGSSAMGTEQMLAAQMSGEAPFDYYQTQFALLKNRVLAARIIRELGLRSKPTFFGRPDLIDRLSSRVFDLLRSFFTYVSDLLGSALKHEEEPLPSGEPVLGVPSYLISRYLSLLQVKEVPKTRLVTVQFNTSDPRLSQELANAHAAAFIRMSMETRFELTKEAREFLEKKLSEVRAKLERSEEVLNRFLQANGMVSLAGSENVVVDRMVDLNKRLTEARARRIELETVYRMTKNKNAQYLSQIIDNSMIQQLKSRLDTLEAEKARLSTTFKPDHPRFMELSQQISQAERRLNLEIGKIVRGIEADYTAARGKEQELQGEAERQQQAALNLKERGLKYTVLQGEVEASRAVYDSVLKRLNEASVSKDAPVSNIQIIEPAETPSSPSFPQTQRNLLLAGAIGLVLGAVLAVFLEYLDVTIKTPEDIWRAVAMPTFGVVPHLRRVGDRAYGYGLLPKGSPVRHLADPSTALAMMVVHYPLSIISESYRTIRTSLLLSQAEKPPQVVLLTSVHPGEGKTVTTLNLAIALAQSGHTVVVVDSDLRAGNCHNLLGLRNHRGLTNVLTGGLTLEEGVQGTAMAGLALLSRGSTAPNPAELLGSRKMKEVVKALRERFDFVLLDSPPAIAISDAAVLSQLSDGVLLVVREQETTRDALRWVVERLEAVRAPILGAVLNAVDFRNPDYVDYRRYYGSTSAEAQRETGGER